MGTEASGRAGGALRVNARLVLPPGELQVTFSRAGGPGGQNVNKVASKVTLRFSVQESAALGDRRRSTIEDRLASRITSGGDLLIQASRHREQRRNLEDARRRLAALLAEALRPRRARVKTRPTRGSKERRLAQKRHRSRIKGLRRGEDT